tara:strand:- start:305 stop:925 length:621 start_codon:yes stop_codon:yes gene_type:complete
MNFIHKNENKNFSSSQGDLPKAKNEFKFEDEKILEAIIFASKEPVSVSDLKKTCPFIEDMGASLKNLTDFYSNRSVNLIKIKNTYAFRTLPYYSNYITQTLEKKVKLSKAAKETLAVIAYHQPVTRTEIEDIRGVSLYKGLMDNLLETKWVNIGPRRDTPGMPVTYITTNDFLDHFGLHTVKDLPNFKELKEAGFLADFKDEEFEV